MSEVFESPKKAEKQARRQEVNLKKESDQMLKTIGQLTLERDFLQDCFRQCGLPGLKYYNKVVNIPQKLSSNSANLSM